MRGIGRHADSLKALQGAAEQPEIDPSQMFLYGTSQGGGLALQVSALSDIPAFAISNVPHMCHMEFGMMNAGGSLTEIAEYLRLYPQAEERVLATISYFD